MTPTPPLPLDPHTPLRQGAACKVCGGFARPFDSVDFLKFASEADPLAYGLAGVPVPYHRCDDCGFLFTTAFDAWSQQDFATRIYNEDYPLIDAEYQSIRPHQTAQTIAGLLGLRRDLHILDYGSGSGEFGHLMDARGFGVEGYDPFSNPVRPEGRFDLITCFEVIEHGPNPRALLADMAALLAEDGMIVFTQPMQPPDIAQRRGSWWYIAPRNGHVSIFTADALALLAAGAGLIFHQGDGLHAFSRPSPSPAARAILARIGEARLCARLAAPDEAMPEQQQGAWHGLERTDAARYRWTGADALMLHPGLSAPDAATLRVIVPFLNEIKPGFAAACRMELGGEPVPCRVEGGRLIAEHRFSRLPAGPLVLLTPPPRSPRELRGSPDGRRLGLAVPVIPWTSRLG